ncbi:MAG: NAD-dependent protein deacetylase, SIR2 family [Lachnospiraceae bacterium]|nr:NAD-dependent protein deacetylase, SIR2 family [Lachnospiraceae bacterium]
MHHKNVSKNIDSLHKWILEADAIIIGAGSGLSSACGYDFYHNQSILEESFPDFYHKYGFRSLWDGYYYLYSCMEDQWGYYSHFIQWLRELNVGDTYKELNRILSDKSYFILTSNVDGQFFKLFPKEKIFPFQGDYRYLQCGQPCHDKIYENDKMIHSMVKNTNHVSIPSDLVPRCPHCGHLMVPWVRDDTFLEGEYWKHCQKNYEDFLNRYKDEQVLFLELGVGDMTPSVIKLPFWDLTSRLPYAKYASINLSKSSVPEQIKERAISIAADLLTVLKQL